MPLKTKSVLVTGDVVVDHQIYLGERMTPDAPAPTGTQEQITNGGAGLLFRILETISSQSAREASAEPAFRVEFGLRPDVFQGLPSALHGFTLWQPFPQKDNRAVWRMAQPLGYGALGGAAHSFAEYAAASSQQPAVVVIDDAGLGFRNNTQQAAWPATITNHPDTTLEWVVLKMSSPVGQGDMWRRLSAGFRDRLVVIVSIDDIRREEVRVSRGISWERTAMDLAEELCFNSEIRPLLNCRHLIIHFKTEGALHVASHASGRNFQLIYDSHHQEEEWSDGVAGAGLGYTSCLAASIVERLLQSTNAPAIAEGIRAGLSAMRTMHVQGHGPEDNDQPGFPFDAVAHDIKNPQFGYATIPLPDPEKTELSARKGWTIMTAFLEREKQHQRPLFGMGRRIAVIGPRALSQVPCARFGKMITADRHEIESLRNIRALILDYEKHDLGKKPLSLAVFGPPGAGKSFGIVQIARGILGADAPILEFNLSQFADHRELIGAFHQVRDRALLGITPVVFWDEFDANKYQWLQYLLAPMQDGKFLEGQITHPIGKSIFVFAGGTSYDMENFGPKESDEIKWNEFKLKKGPDFKSRLSGYLNVLGPNRRQSFDPAQNQWIDDPGDVCFPIRRALLLRSILTLKDEKRLTIDHGILSALIETRRFNHGARSLEKIVQRLRKQDSTAIRRSDLPAEDILSLHVDPADFMAIVNRDLKFKTHAEELAPFVHEFYRELGRREKWLKPEMDIDYALLTDDYKEDNRAAAARIPQVLDLIGLYVAEESVSPSLPLQDILDTIEANVELLAEAEHDDWMAHKRRNGWKYGAQRDDSRKVHDCMKPFLELSERNKEKDRNAVRHYPEILKAAHYTIVSSLV